MARFLADRLLPALGPAALAGGSHGLVGPMIIPTVGVSSSILLPGEPLSAKVFIALLLTLAAVAIVMLHRRPSHDIDG
ncbi:MAG: hypothetical protein RI841_09360 [Halomonas sp.]|uniref:hypothetical protein n=1 Tax=Halomonas sp. TaxID=1486246 RepID=UPI00286FEF34|nr:hypothetical protein [Halomonas sp.]MDR9439688.1 hypothetical protein [Halomonas sp.]